MILGEYEDAAETTISSLKQLCAEVGKEGDSPYQLVMRDRLGQRMMGQFRRVVYELHNGKWTLDVQESWAVFFFHANANLRWISIVGGRYLMQRGIGRRSRKWRLCKRIRPSWKLLEREIRRIPATVRFVCLISKSIVVAPLAGRLQGRGWIEDGLATCLHI
jgi:hypothetical protein